MWHQSPSQSCQVVRSIGGTAPPYRSSICFSPSSLAISPRKLCTSFGMHSMCYPVFSKRLRPEAKAPSLSLEDGRGGWVPQTTSAFWPQSLDRLELSQSKTTGLVPKFYVSVEAISGSKPLGRRAMLLRLQGSREGGLMPDHQIIAQACRSRLNKPTGTHPLQGFIPFVMP